MSTAEAESESRRAMGNVTLAREDARAVWIAPWIESVWQDISYAGRVLWRDPGFALLAIGALTAGIGLNTSLFAVYGALAMEPWSVRDPGRVFRLVNNSAFDLRKRAGGPPSGFSQAELDYFTPHATTITGDRAAGRAGDFGRERPAAEIVPLRPDGHRPGHVRRGRGDPDRREPPGGLPAGPPRHADRSAGGAQVRVTPLQVPSA